MTSEASQTLDHGLGALVMLLRFQGIGIDPEQIRHQFAATPIGVPEMLRCAKELGLKARVSHDQMGAARQHAIARNRRLAGRQLSAARQGCEDKIMVQAPVISATQPDDAGRSSKPCGMAGSS